MGVGGVDLPALLRVGDVDAITLTSASVVRNLIKRLTAEGGSGTLDLLEHIYVVCIGASTAQAAKECGLKNILVPQQYSLNEMVSVLEEHFG
jgi:uroporphyrinogen-III synthase